MPRTRDQDHGQQARRDPVVKAAQIVAEVWDRRLGEIVAALKKKPEPDGRTNIHVTSVELKRTEASPMPPIDHMPDFTLPSISVRAGLAVVGPKKADGTYATGGAWSTSDESALPLEAVADSTAVDPDGNPILDESGNPIPVYNVIANTPLEPAAGETAGGTVTWKASGMADVDIKVIYGDPALGHAAITASQLPEA
jgi:hypothetical protein